MTMPLEDRVALHGRRLDKADIEVCALRFIVLALLDAVAEADPGVVQRTQEKLANRMEATAAEALGDGGEFSNSAIKSALSFLGANVCAAAND